MVIFSIRWCYDPVLNGHGQVLNGPSGLVQKDSHLLCTHMCYVGGMVEETKQRP